ncbi:MAG: metal ABC transporter permease [Clostridiales bacterium]|nr:metal ABC transporter permease [Clostridiales bacterium]
MFDALLRYEFLRNAVWAGLFASLLSGVIGVIIVEKKLVMMSGGIAHTAYGGVGLGYLMGFEPILGAFAFSLAAALGVGWFRRRGGGRPDVVIGLFWSLGMALGILFIALTPGYPPDLTSYLFGGILSVTRTDLMLMAALTIVVIALIAALYNDWKAYLFDDEFARIIGMNTVLLENLLLGIIAATVVVLIRSVGIILSLALMTAPAATAALFSGSLRGRMAWAAVLGAGSCLAGLWISYRMNVASGAAIVIISVAIYIVACAMRRIAHRSGRACACAGEGERKA